MSREEDISWNSLAFASLWVRQGVALAVALFVGIAGVYLFVFPLQDEREKQGQDLQEAKARYAQRLLQLGTTPSLSLLDERVEEKAAYLRTYSALPMGVQSLMAAARRSQCRVVDAKHLADAESGAFWAQRWQLRLKGDYFQLLRFIQHMDKDAVAAVAERLVMEEDGGLTVSLTVTQYWLKEDAR